MDIKTFKGLNNVTDPLRAGLGWLTSADNVNITNTGGVTKREGYAKVRDGSFTGAYTTLDHQRMYLVDGGVLKTNEGAVLRTGLSSATMFWTEVNEVVYFNNGVDAGAIRPDNSVIEWRWATDIATPTITLLDGTDEDLGGTISAVCTKMTEHGETGTGQFVQFTVPAGSRYRLDATDLLYATTLNGTVLQRNGADLTNAFFDPLPAEATVIQHWKGRIYAAQYFPSENQTAVWFSQPLGYHLFNLNSDFILVPGQVLMLAPHDDALIVGTDAKVFAYTGEKLELLADYGIVPGQHWALDTTHDGQKRTLFWTLRGVCAALPFLNLTERQVSVAPGVSAGGTLVQRGGQKRYLVALKQGGAAFNKYP